MSSTVSLNIKGLQDPVQVHGEYTDEIVNTYWAPRFETIAQIFGKNAALDSLAEDPDPNFEDLTPEDALELWEAVNELKNAAANGIDRATGQPVPPGQEPQERVFFLTIEMGSALNRLIKSLDSVGFDTINPPDISDPNLVTQMRRWQDLDDVGLRDILVRMGNAIGSNRTLQALIELEYVKAGNDLIGAQLEELDEALKLTKEILDTLGLAQSLHNKISSATRSVNNEEDEFFTWVPDKIQWNPQQLNLADFPSSAASAVNIYNQHVGFYIYRRDKINEFLENEDIERPLRKLDDIAELRKLIEDYNNDARALEIYRNELNDLVNDEDLKVTIQIPELQVPPPINVLREDSQGDRRRFASGGGDLGYSVRVFDQTPPPPGSRDADFIDTFNNPEEYTRAIDSALDRAFKDPLGTVIDVTEADINQFIRLQNELVQHKDRLKQLNPDSPLIERLETLLSDMTQAPANRPVAMTDTGFIIGDNAEDPLNRLLFWISDGYHVRDNIDAGVNQRHLTEAITNAQGLNDTQKEDLRRFIYLFEQFYKSSSSMLQAIDRMINKMAQNIKG